MNHYQERMQARADRLRARAEKARGEAEARFAQTTRMAGVMNGSPILIGHHSEKRHRRDIERMDGNMRKSIEENRRAAELERRADAVGTGGISSDDPEAATRIRERIAELEAQRDQMKAINAEYVKACRQGGDAAGWKAVAAKVGEAEALRLAKHASYTWDNKPHAKFALTNLGANIRRLKARVESLERDAVRPVAEPVVVPGLRIEEWPDENRIALLFDAKPGDEVRRYLKLMGFRWSPTNGAWQRHLNGAGRCAADAVRRYIESRNINNDKEARDGETSSD